MFESNGPLSASFREHCTNNREKIEGAYGSSIEAMTRFIDAQYELLRLTAWTGHSDEFSRRGPTQAILYSVLYKNAFLFLTAIDLARVGLYGPAGTLLRPVLEGLVCAKYCTLAEDEAVFNTWRAGNHVSLTHQVLKKIEYPTTDEMKVLWDGLNKMAHASIYAQQLASEFEDIKKEVHGILAIVHMLTVFNYHVLIRHFLTPTAIYYTASYGDKSALASARRTVRALATEARKLFGKDGKQFLRESCARWRLKGPTSPGDLTAASSGRSRAAEAGR